MFRCCMSAFRGVDYKSSGSSVRLFLQTSTGYFRDSRNSFLSSSSLMIGKRILLKGMERKVTGPTFMFQCAYVHHHRERMHLEKYLGIVRSKTRKANRHWNPLFRRARAQKFIRPILHDFDEKREAENAVTLEEVRSYMKKQGIPSGSRRFNEKPLLVSCTNEIMDPFKPLEGEGKLSLTSGSSVQKTMQKFNLWQWRKDRSAVKKIVDHDEEWSVDKFESQAEELYIAAHQALQNRDSSTLHDLVTEHAYPQMWDQLRLRSLRWRYLGHVERPKVVRVRVAAQLHKNNQYAQVTVRLHTKQSLAIYDQFGRLILGSETIEIPVLEYVVFERHLVRYGVWRLHEKISPPAVRRQPVLKTYQETKAEEYKETEGQLDNWIEDDQHQKT